MLTAIQEKALTFICRKAIDEKLAPTLRELCSYMGYSAIGSAQDLAKALQKKGFLSAADRQAARHNLLPTPKAFSNLGFSDISAGIPDSFLIPCLGEVPAGSPLEAIGEKVGQILVSPHLLPKPTPKPESLFALKAKGDSMIGAGILDGDWLVVKSVQEAQKGDIVVARLHDEATVKTLAKDKKEGWYLQPENTKYKAIYASEQPFEVVGKVISVQRFLS